ncbi:MAG: FKBP-type peptidyl-prolyl cis-trans isomerase [Rhodothermales bacterium]
MLQRQIINGLILVFGLITLSACDSNDEDPEINDPPFQVVADADYTETATGLKYFDLVTGTGDVATVGDTLSVEYTGWLQNGFIFDTSVYLPRPPFSVIIGTSPLIEGWTEGLQGMQEGGQRQLVIPPSLGYGTRGQGAIPPNAVMIFEVEVVSLRKAG